jgi:hypothetical protein
LATGFGDRKNLLNLGDTVDRIIAVTGLTREMLEGQTALIE